MNAFENSRLENVLQMYASTEWRKPMPVAGLLYHEVVRQRVEIGLLQEELVRSGQRYMTQMIMANEIQASLNYELNKTFWQRLKDLFR